MPLSTGSGRRDDLPSSESEVLVRYLFRGTVMLAQQVVGLKLTGMIWVRSR